MLLQKFYESLYFYKFYLSRIDKLFTCIIIEVIYIHNRKEMKMAMMI